MTRNDILRRLRYCFNYNDRNMMKIFAAGDYDVSREQLSAWLKKDDAEGYERCKDIQLASFLNGLINTRRGRKEGEPLIAEKQLNNNLIFRKLKIALDLKSDDILAIMDLADLRMSRNELSALFRNQNHKHYRQCKDQILRNFIYGLQLKYREKKTDVKSVKRGLSDKNAAIWGRS